MARGHRYGDKDPLRFFKRGQTARPRGQSSSVFAATDAAGPELIEYLPDTFRSIRNT